MTQYPVILAGQTITASLLSSMLPTFVYKSVSEDRLSNTTLTDDTDLTMQLLANATYHAEFFIHYATLTTAGFQTAWTVPSGTSGNRWSIGGGSLQHTFDNVSAHVGVHAFATAVQHADRNSSTNQIGSYEEGTFTTTNAGTLALQWAQVSSVASNTRVASGSFMRVTRLA